MPRAGTCPVLSVRTPPVYHWFPSPSCPFPSLLRLHVHTLTVSAKHLLITTRGHGLHAPLTQQFLIIRVCKSSFPLLRCLLFPRRAQMLEQQMKAAESGGDEKKKKDNPISNWFKKRENSTS